MEEDHGRREQTALWDRFGQALGDMGTVTQSIWRRNMVLWSDVSRHLRSDRYTPEEMAADAARALAVAVDNAADIWSLLSRAPEREWVTAGLPTAFLFFARRDQGATTHIPPEPVLLHVPSGEAEDLPDRAQFSLNGPSQDGVQALQTCLAVRLQAPRTYLLEPHDVKRLVPGVYDGLIYLVDPPRPLADLRIIVG
jgi:hypothetical protein